MLLDIEIISNLTSFGDIGQKKNEVAGDLFLTRNSVKSSFGVRRLLGTFRSDYDYEYQFFNVYPVRMRDCVRLSRQLALSSKSRRRLDANYEIFKNLIPQLRVHCKRKGELTHEN